MNPADWSSEAIVGLLTLVSGWFFGHRKSKAEATAAEIQNEENAIKIWQQLANTLKTELEEMRTQFNELQKRQYELEKENQDLKRQIRDLQKVRT